MIALGTSALIGERQTRLWERNEKATKESRRKKNETRFERIRIGNIGNFLTVNPRQSEKRRRNQGKWNQSRTRAGSIEFGLENDRETGMQGKRIQ
jgi:hypothetical protein